LLVARTAWRHSVRVTGRNARPQGNGDAGTVAPVGFSPGRVEMLVLTRKVGERVVLGGGIVVQVLEASGRRVRFGIEAPREVAVWRDRRPSAEEPGSTRERAPRKPR
jgi:hypothetical protein